VVVIHTSHKQLDAILVWLQLAHVICLYILAPHLLVLVELPRKMPRQLMDHQVDFKAVLITNICYNTNVSPVQVLVTL